MHTQIVMDHTGDSRHHFDPSCDVETLEGSEALSGVDRSRLHRRQEDR
jgi:hypothetical protein